MFGKYGPVSDVYIPLDYYTRQPRGFAYVQYPFFVCKGQEKKSSSLSIDLHILQLGKLMKKITVVFLSDVSFKEQVKQDQVSSGNKSRLPFQDQG